MLLKKLNVFNLLNIFLQMSINRAIQVFKKDLKKIAISSWNYRRKN